MQEKCSFCCYEGTRENLVEHLATGCEGLQFDDCVYSCEICEDEFKDQDTLKRHVKVKHESEYHEDVDIDNDKNLENGMQKSQAGTTVAGNISVLRNTFVVSKENENVVEENFDETYYNAKMKFPKLIFWVNESQVHALNLKNTVVKVVKDKLSEFESDLKARFNGFENDKKRYS